MEKLENRWKEASKKNVQKEPYIPPQAYKIEDESHRAFVLRCLSLKMKERPSAAAAEAELGFYISRARNTLS